MPGYWAGSWPRSSGSSSKPPDSPRGSRGQRFLLLPNGSLQLHKRWEGLSEGRTSLRVTPVVNHRHLLDAGNRAARRAGFHGVILVFEVLPTVLLQRNARVTSLLRTVMHQPLLANVKVAAPGTTAPLMRGAASNIPLELVQPSIRSFAHLHNLEENPLLMIAERAELAGAVVQDAHRAGEAQIKGSA